MTVCIRFSASIEKCRCRVKTSTTQKGHSGDTSVAATKYPRHSTEYSADSYGCSKWLVKCWLGGHVSSASASVSPETASTIQARFAPSSFPNWCASSTFHPKSKTGAAGLPPIQRSEPTIRRSMEQIRFEDSCLHVETTTINTSSTTRTGVGKAAPSLSRQPELQKPCPSHLVFS